MRMDLLSLTDDKHVCYLLLHLGVPSDSQPPPKKHLIATKEAGKALGVKVWPVNLRHNVKAQGDLRYLLSFPRFRRDDKYAIKLAESVLYAVSITFGPFMDPNETLLVCRIPAKLVRDRDYILLDELIQLYDEFGAPSRSIFYQSAYMAEPYIEAAWRITPIIFQDERLFQAVRFLTNSQDDFYVWPGEISEVLAEPDLLARSGWEQSRLENALQNAFKAVEAVVGDPPKDDRKFFLKIKAIGLDPYESVGYGRKLPLHEVIRSMNAARDKKAAHGSASDRTITLGEMMGYQACARYIVLAAIERQLGGSIF